jgi:hypothetical protein
MNEKKESKEILRINVSKWEKKKKKGLLSKIEEKEVG